MKTIVLAVLLPATSWAGVWDDCLLWYNGGAVDKNGDGKFTNGEMVDVRHAGVADSPTHGGTLRNATAIYDTVKIETADVTFPLQNNRVLKCPVLNFTAPAETNGTKISVYGNVVQIPDVLSVDNDHYSALIRFRREKDHAWNSSYQIVMQLGFDYSQKRGLSIALANAPDDNDLYIGYDGRSFVDTSLSLGTTKGGWHELAILVNGTSIEIGVVDTTAKTPIPWKTVANIREGSLKPYNGNFRLGGESVTTSGDAPGKTLFRGMIHMASVWNRTLTRTEVLEAFSSVPSLFQVGLPNVSGHEMFAGAAGTVSMTAQPEEWRKFPSSLSAGDSVNITFPLDSTQLDQPQMVRLVARNGTSGSVSVSVNGKECGVKNVKGGTETSVYVPAGCLTEGANICTLTRTDAGSGPLGFNAVQMAGSWRIGMVNNSWNEMESAGNTGEDFYIETARRWPWFRRVVLNTHSLNVHLGDVLGRWGNNTYLYTWKLKKNAGDPASMSVKLNGTTISAPVTLEDTDWHVFSLELSETNLVRGADNVLRWENSSSTWYAFDYHELTVRRPHTGLRIILR